MKKLILLFLFIGSAFSTLAQNYYLEDRWPALKFQSPVGMHTAPDSSNRIFVIEQTGRIKVFKDTAVLAITDTSSFLDITGSVQFGGEAGLLGLAFHPQFKQNGFAFVNYTRKNPLTTVVSRFKLMADNPNKLDPTSEKIILEIPQPFTNHNGGSVLFGDDGYLYIGMGDGGSGGDPGNRAQNKGVLLGKLLRLDIDVPIDDSTYLIPADNPLVNNNLGYKKEIFATGLRNPWKISKDPESSTIWIADVGQSAWEEVDTARNGANYGWKITEGNASYSNCGSCDTSNYEPPLHVYGHNRGISITGGYVYRGKELFKIPGTYIYGDYGTRRVWGLSKNSQGKYVNDSLLTGNLSISGFGLDNSKEIYAIGYSTNAGKLQKLRCGPPTPVITSSNLGVCVGDTITLTAPAGANLAGYQWSTGDTTRTIKVSAIGTYSFTVKTQNTFGCWSYASQPKTVLINDFPQAPILDSVRKCPGDTVSLNLPSGLTYSWSTGFTGNPFSTTSVGDFWVFGKDPIGCKSDTAYFSIDQYPIPSTPVLVLNGNYLETDSVPGVTYGWFLNGSLLETTTVPRLLSVGNGVYSVLLATPQVCYTPFSNSIVITSNEKSFANFLRVFPNPADKNLEVVWESGEIGKETRLSIFNMNGQIIHSETVTSQSNSAYKNLDISRFPNGIYQLQIQSGDKRESLRFQKME